MRWKEDDKMDQPQQNYCLAVHTDPWSVLRRSALGKFINYWEGQKKLIIIELSHIPKSVFPSGSRFCSTFSARVGSHCTNSKINILFRRPQERDS